MRKSIIVFGYWENNLGDDLFLDLFVNKFKLYKVYILTQKKYKSVYNYPNVKVIAYDSLLYKAINRALITINLPELFYFYYAKIAKVSVFLGGSLFMEKGNWKRQLNNLKYMVDNTEASYVVGSNFGPYNSTEFVEEYKRLFMNMSSICFRDRKSYKMFKEFINVKYYPDVVLNIKDKYQYVNNRIYEDYYVISIIELQERIDLKAYSNNYESFIENICIKLLKQGFNVILMSFCSKEGDLKVAFKIQEKLSQNKERVKVYSHKNIDESINVISNANGIIATRLHSMIIGFALDIPVFPIVYSEKMENVIKDYEFTNPYVWIKDLNEKHESIAISSLCNGPNIKKEILENSKKQFNDIQKYLQEKI